jgi:DNA-binding beta-propeller fold protein YncE
VLSRLGAVLRTFGEKAGLIRPSGIAIDRARRLLYVSDPASLKAEDHRVLVFTLDGALVRVLGKGKGDAPGQFYFPVYLAVDADGRLWVGDTMNFRLQVFAPDGSYVASHGEHGDGPGTFARIKGLGFDRFKNLYVVEGEHAVVQLFNQSFEPLMFFGGNAPKIEFLELPSAIAIDPVSDRVYVANEVNSRINVYELVNTSAEDSLRPAETPAETSKE